MMPVSNDKPKVAPYWKSDCGRAVVYVGDCQDVMNKLEPDQFHAIVTDPPYGLEFMGKEWDAPWKNNEKPPGFDKRTAEQRLYQEWFAARSVEILRVAKPGAHLLSFGGCYDNETEVLTKRGWIKFIDAKQDDLFASLNLESHKVEWQRPKELVRKQHDGEMIRYKTNRIDLLVTPNHNMLVSDPTRVEYKLRRADEHPNTVKMTKTSNGVAAEYTTSITIPPSTVGTGHGHFKTLPAVDIPLSDWMPFFGLWIAEGSACCVQVKNGESYFTDICHFNESNTREVAMVMSKYFTVKLYRGRLRIYDKRLTSYLMQFGHAQDKFVPQVVKEASPRDIRTFLEWYARGDGDKEGRIYTCSPRLIDDVQEIAMYAGWAADWSIAPNKKINGKIDGREIIAKRPQYIIRLLKCQTNPQVYSRMDEIAARTVMSKTEWGGRDVFCVELQKHHTLYVRRNGKAVWCGNTRMWHRMACAIEDAGFDIRDTIMWVYGSGFPKSMDVSKQIDKMMGAEREVVGEKKAGMGSGKTFGMLQSEGTNHLAPTTVPTTDAAKLWSGWGTALKPSLEPVIVARKPIQGTVAQNVMEHGCGGINVDGCRVGTTGATINQYVVTKTSTGSGIYAFNKGDSGDVGMNGDFTKQRMDGRWPANLIHDGSEEVVGLFPETGPSKAATMPLPKTPGDSNGLKHGDSSHEPTKQGFDDQGGSAARFFYTAKADKDDRWHMTDSSGHPTVKPLDLMRYLVRLVCAKGGTVLDPFMGSGSTGVAAIEEGCYFVGIEQSEEYAKIAVDRLKIALGQHQHVVKLESGKVMVKSAPPPQRKLR
jgi:site-specific DNA-methyltransferase (adenine-specific)